MTTFPFRRYTTLPFLLDILVKKKLTLLDPENWDDQNDSYYIELYKENQQLKSVLALCFAEAKESYHHWKIYSGNTSGVCIDFKKEIILQNLKAQGLRIEKVKYKSITQFKREPPEISQYPFTKANAFIDEIEFRAIYEDKDHEYTTREFTFDINSIEKIVFNPWIPETVFNSLIVVIREIDGCENIKIIKTELTNNEKWKNLGRELILLGATEFAKKYHK